MPLTRRTLLQASVTATAGLAGIAGRADQGGAAAQVGIDDDPTVEQPRNPEGDVVIYERREDDRQRADRQLISRREHLDRLEFADGVPAADVEAARTFLEDTDYDEETIYLVPWGVDSCYRYRIKSVSWTPPHEVEHSYCKELRPPDVRCRADSQDGLVLLFRLPVALSYDVTRSGSSGRGSCDDTDTDYSVIEWNESNGER